MLVDAAGLASTRIKGAWLQLCVSSMSRTLTVAQSLPVPYVFLLLTPLDRQLPEFPETERRMEEREDTEF